MVQTTHISCCHFHHFITVFSTHTVTHLHNKLQEIMVLRANRMKIFNKADNAALMWLLAGQHSQNKVQCPWRGEETGPIVSQENSSPQSMPSKDSGQLHAHVHILHKHIHVVVNKRYANYQPTKHLQGIIQAPFIWPPLPSKHSWRDCFAYGTCTKLIQMIWPSPMKARYPRDFKPGTGRLYNRNGLSKDVLENACEEQNRSARCGQQVARNLHLLQWSGRNPPPNLLRAPEEGCVLPQRPPSPRHQKYLLSAPSNTCQCFREPVKSSVSS